MKPAKREWVKNAIIIFLAVMLVLTFFSNTIMNYSLPKVAAEYTRNAVVSEQIRGSGTVEASDTYEMKYAQERLILSVNVKAGDAVEKGQVLMTLESLDESDKTKEEDIKYETDLTAAKDKLDELNLDYQKALVAATGNDYSLEYLDIKNLEADILKAKNELDNVTLYASQYDDAKKNTLDKTAELNKLKKNSTDLNEQLTIVSSDDYTFLDDKYSKLIVDAANAVKSAEKSKTAADKKVADCEKNITSGDSDSTLSGYKRQIEQKENEINALYDELIAGGNPTEISAKIATATTELKYLNEDYQSAFGAIYKSDISKAELNNAITSQNSAIEKCDKAKQNLADVKNEVRKKIKVDINKLDDLIVAAEAKVADATLKEAEAKEKSSLTTSEAEKNIRTMERDVEAKKIELAKKQQTDIGNSKLNTLELQVKQENITEQEEIIKKMKEDREKVLKKRETESSDIKAPVSGTISQLFYVSGSTIKPDTPIVNIEMSELGYKMSFNVTNEQAKKIKVGDNAELQYFWNGNAEAKIQSIKPDSTNPTKFKTVTLSLTGDITPGENINILLGGKGQNYDTVIPNSSIREDNNGKFVLKVAAKSTPLGNRYIAQRVNIQVIVTDGTYSAVTGEFEGGDFIIKTSNKPINSGDQVRMASE